MQRGVLADVLEYGWDIHEGTSKLSSMTIKLYPAAMRAASSSGSAF